MGYLEHQGVGDKKSVSFGGGAQTWAQSHFCSLWDLDMYYVSASQDFPSVMCGKETAYQFRRCKRHRV